MPDKPRRIYWDSCVLLSYVNGDDDRKDLLEQLFEEAEAEAIEILTSTLSVVEVAYGKAEYCNESAEVLAIDSAAWFEAHRAECTARDCIARTAA